MSIQRYEHDCGLSGCDGMVADADGEWVKFKDIEHLLKEDEPKTDWADPTGHGF